MKKVNSFSLSEALISLLIVCLITIASIPVLTKKHKPKTLNIPHGTWTCYLNNGVLTSKLEVPGETTVTQTYSGSYCNFTPPPKVEKYNITVVGGGGGGAAGLDALSSSIAKTGWNSSGYIYPKSSGDYKLILVGNGGTGGWNGHCGDDALAGGGGSGGVIVADVSLDSDYSYSYSIGGRGSTVSLPGNVSISGAGVSFSVQGGHAGLRRAGNSSCSWVGGSGCTTGDDSGCGGPGGNNGWRSRPSNYPLEANMARVTNAEAVNLVKQAFSSHIYNGALYYGAGGYASSCIGDTCNQSANSGAVYLIKKSGNSSGSAGKPGSVSSKTFSSSTGAIRAYVGMGGSGGKTAGSNGSAGTRSYITNTSGSTLLVGQGGEDGASGYKSEGTKSVGESGSFSSYVSSLNLYKSYGGYASGNTSAKNAYISGLCSRTGNTYIQTYCGYGSSGGGGGAKNTEWGTGASGMPGVVIIDY